MNDVNTLKRIHLHILSLVLVCLAAGCSRQVKPEPSCGFVSSLKNQRVAWPTRRLPIRLYVHESVPPEAYQAIEAAIAEFNNKLGDGQREIFQIQARGIKDQGYPVKDGNSTIYWMKDWDPTMSKEQARTTIYWSGSEIFEADLRINAKDPTLFTSLSEEIQGVDLMSLLVHEFGHALGLEHNETVGSVMNFSLDAGQSRRHLSDLDYHNLKCEY